MNNDGVSIAFKLIIAELERVADEIAKRESVAVKERRYDDAQRLSETGKNLYGFAEKVNDLLLKWQARIDVNVRRKIQIYLKMITIRGKSIENIFAFTPVRQKKKKLLEMITMRLGLDLLVEVFR